MLVPKLRFKEFENKWNYYTFEKLINAKSNTYNPQKDRKEYKCIELEHINQENGTINGYISSIEQKSCKNFFIKGSVLFGKLRPYLKKYWLASFSGVCSSEIWVLNSKNMQIINNDFIFYLIQNHYFIELCKLSTGSKMPRADWSYIKEQSIAIPNVEEQNKISKLLLLLDKKIELQKQKIETLKSYKIGMIQNLKSNSQNWNEYKIKNLFEITRGQVIPKTCLKSIPDEEYKYPVYSSQTSNYGILGYDKTFDFDGEFLTWTTDGANAGKVFYRNGKFRCTNVCGLLYSSKNPVYINLLTADLLNYETPKYVSYVGNPKLMNHVMADIKIKLPSLEIQNKISHIFLIFNKKLILEEQKLEKLNTFKKSLLQQMFI